MSETEVRRRKFRRFKSVTSDSDKVIGQIRSNLAESGGHPKMKILY